MLYLGAFETFKNLNRKQYKNWRENIK